MLKDIFRGVARNTAIMLVQQIVTWASTFLLLIFLPRYLGPVEYGRLFLVVSVSGIFLHVVNYGGSLALAKDVARDRPATDRLLSEALGLRVVLAGASLAGLIAFSLVARYDGEVLLMMLIAGVSLFFDGAITCWYAAFQGNEQLRYTSLAVIAKRSFISLAGVGALLAGAKALGMVIILSLGTVLNLLMLILNAKVIVSSIPPLHTRNVTQQLRAGLPYFLLTTFSAVYYRIDAVMLSKMSPEAVVGWYGAAYRLFDSFGFLPYLITVALYPVLSRLWQSDGDVHRRAFQKSLEYLTIFGIPLCIGAIAFGENLVHTFFGAGVFAPSVILLQVLSAGLLVLYVDMLFGTVLLSSDMQKRQSIIALTAIPLNIGLNLLFIPYTQQQYANGGIGAAAATVVTELCIMISLLVLVHKRGFMEGFRFRVVGKGVVAGLLMAGSIFLLQGSLPWLVSALLSVVVYGCAALLLRAFHVSEVVLLAKAMKVRSFSTTKPDL